MDKNKDYENFEVEEPKDESTESNTQCQCLFKIIIILLLSGIIVSQIIYLFVINSSLKDKNTELSNINLKKYMLDDGNKKLDRTLNEHFKKDYELDEEAKKKDNEIKSKETLIKDYIQKTKKLIKILDNSKPVEEILEINEEKKKKVNELKTELDKLNQNFRGHFKSKIIDSWGELDRIKNLIKKNKTAEYEMNQYYFKLCYAYEFTKDSGELDYDEANYAINFNENDIYAIIFNTNIFGRYGIFLTQNNDDNYRVGWIVACAELRRLCDAD